MGYDAFISYSHGADMELAPAVRDGLQRLAKPWNKRRALSIFLDQASLELSAELGSSLDDRLKDTRWLVLFMSEESARSHWVGQEIAEWTRTKSKGHLALVLTSGEIVWDAEARDFDYERSTAVSEGMRNVFTGQESEPLYLDLRWTKELPGGERKLDLTDLRFRDAIATLAAPIHGIPKDQLEGEDVRQHRKARRLRRAAVTGLAVLTLVAVLFGLVAVKEQRKAQRQLALSHRDMGAVERDTFRDLVKASQHFMTAAANYPGSDLEASRAARLAGELLVQNTELQALMELGGPVVSAAFDPDERRVLTRSQDGVVSVWDAEKGELIARTVHDTVAEAKGAVFAEDEIHVLSWHDTNPRGGGEILHRLWHAAAAQAGAAPEEAGVESGQPVPDSADLHCDRCDSAVVVRTAGAADRDPTRHGARSLKVAGRVVEVQDGSKTISSDEHRLAVKGAVFSHDGTRILSWDGSYDTGSSLRLWDTKERYTADGYRLALLAETEHVGEIDGVRFSRDDTRVLCWGGTGQTGWVRLFKPKTGEILVDSTHHGRIGGGAFSQDDRRAMCWGGDYVSGWVRIWSADGGDAVLDMPAEPGNADSGAGRGHAWSWRQDGLLELRNTRSGAVTEIAFSKREEPEVVRENSVGSSHEGRFSLAAARGNDVTEKTGELHVTMSLELRDASEKVLWKAEDTIGFGGAAFSRDDTWLVAWGGMTDMGWIRVVDVESHELVGTVQHASMSYGGVAFGPDHDRFASWGGRAVRVWEVSDGGVRLIAESDDPDPQGAFFNEDGKRLLSWAPDRVWLWQADTGVLIAENRCKRWVQDVAFSDDETHVFWKHGDGVRLWRIDADYDTPRDLLVAGVEARTGIRLDLELNELVHLPREEWLRQKRLWEAAAANR